MPGVDGVVSEIAEVHSAPQSRLKPVSQKLAGRCVGIAAAHMKRQIMGREVVVAVTEGRLDFGTWERIFYGEFDGRRQKRVLVKIIGE